MAVPNEATLHTRIKPLKRGEGRNAVRAAAYRSGQKLACERTGETWDYTGRKGIEHSEIIAPDGSPAWATNRQELWNRVENIERRKDSQVAREYEFFFSYDLSSEQRIAIAQEVAREEFVSRGMVADVNIHRYGRAWKEGAEGTPEMVDKWRSWGLAFVDEATSAQTETQHVMVTHKRDGSVKSYRLYQPHCHVQLTMRPITADGENFEKKSVGSVARSWNDQASCDGIRERTAERQNRELEAASSERRVDHRSYEDRRIEAEVYAREAQQAGEPERAAHFEARAQAFTREPEPYRVFASKVKELTGYLRDRFNQWVAVRQRNELRPVIASFDHADPGRFALQLDLILERVGRSFGFDLHRDRDREMEMELER